GVNPTTGQRTLMTTVGEGVPGISGPTFNITVGIASDGVGDIWILSEGNRSGLPVYGLGGALWRVNRETGASALVTVFNDPAQGPLGSVYAILPSPNPQVAVDSGGTIFAIATTFVAPLKDMIFRIDASTGNRTLLSDFSNSNQGPSSGG